MTTTPRTPGLPGAAGARGARLKADGDTSRIMLLLTAKAAREIVEAFKANTEALKRLEGKIDSKADA